MDMRIVRSLLFPRDHNDNIRPFVISSYMCGVNLRMNYKPWDFPNLCDAASPVGTIYF